MAVISQLDQAQPNTDDLNDRHRDNRAYKAPGYDNNIGNRFVDQQIQTVGAMRKRPADMNRFRMRFPSVSASAGFRMQEAAPFIEVRVFRATITALDKMSNLKAGLINLEYYTTEVELKDEERVAFLVGYIGNIFISVQDEITMALGGNGIQITWVNLPSTNPGDPTLTDEPVDSRIAAIKFGIAVMFLYKNVDSRGFQYYLAARISAMASRVGLNAEKCDSLSVFRSMEDAVSYRNIAGNTPALKRLISYAVIEGTHSSGAFGEVCKYLFNILSWTDMTSIVFIHDTLLMTRSPILTRPEVQAEIKALDTAFRAIFNWEFPQFFRIQAESHLTGLLERQKFSILLEVSRRIRGTEASSVGNFAMQKNNKEPLMKELVSIHKAYYREFDTRNLIKTVNRLTQSEAEIEDDEAEFSMYAEKRPRI